MVFNIAAGQAYCLTDKLTDKLTALLSEPADPMIVRSIPVKLDGLCFTSRIVLI